MKNLFTACFAMLLFSISIAFASPFSDVPSTHWAHDAIKKLSEKGIVTGYSDGTYKGTKAVSRYHLAMITAKMLASVEQKPSSISKADLKVLERLTMEFADELSIMGVRTTSLEKDLNSAKEDVSNLKKEVKSLKQIIKDGGDNKVKVSGDITIRNYNVKNFTNTVPTKKQKEHKTETLLRLQLDAKISEKVTASARWNIIENNNINVGPSANNNEWHGNNKRTGDIEVAYLKIKDAFKSNGELKLGRDWYSHGHGLVLHDHIDAISFSKQCGDVDLAFNCFYDRNNSIKQEDYLNVWNINADYTYNHHKMYLGMYYNSRDYNFTETNIIERANNNKNDFRLELGSSGKVFSNSNKLTYDIAGVYNNLKALKYNTLTNKSKDYEGWLGYFALKYESQKRLSGKFSYAYADEESYANIKRQDYNSYCFREETPFEDLSYLVSDGLFVNMKDTKFQLGYKIEEKHSLRVAYDKLQNKKDQVFKTNTDIVTTEYKYKLANNTQIRIVYQNVKDSEGMFSPKNQSKNIYFTEIFARF